MKYWLVTDHIIYQIRLSLSACIVKYYFEYVHNLHINISRSNLFKNFT